MVLKRLNFRPPEARIIIKPGLGEVDWPVGENNEINNRRV